jgi:glycosyltransferase 2 family protein
VRLPRLRFAGPGSLLMRRVETIIIVLALGFYVWFLHHFGTAQVLGYLRLAGWGLVLTISLEAFARIANTLGWRVTMGQYAAAVRFRELFSARIAGEAVDYVTPSAQLGGQFVMALMVKRRVRMAAGLSTVAIAALCEMVGQIVFIAAALIVSLRLVPAAEEFFWPVVAGFTLALALIGGFLYVQTKSPFSYLLRAASKWFGVNPADYTASAAEADAILLDFYARHRIRIAASTLCYVVAWSLGPVEIYILLKLLHQAATFQIALLVEAVGLLIERATFLIPAKLVSQEGGKALILALLGYPPGVGFAVGLLRRAKEMVWVLFGLVCLMVHRMTVGTDTGGPGRSEKRFRLGTVQGEESL